MRSLARTHHRSAPVSLRVHRRDAGAMRTFARRDTPWPSRRPSVRCRVWARDTRTSTPHRSGGVALEFPDEAIEALADAVADRVVERVLNQIESNSTGWLDSAGAAEYLGVSKRRVYDLTSARTITPDGRDGRTPLFTRATLDAYVRSNAG